MRVFIAEATPAVRTRLKELVYELPGFELVGLEATMEGFLTRLQTTRPDLLILGPRLADSSSFEALDLARTGDNLTVILLSDRIDGHYLYRARSLGADYLLESPRDLDFVPALLRQIAGSRFSAPVPFTTRPERDLS